MFIIVDFRLKVEFFCIVSKQEEMRSLFHLQTRSDRFEKNRDRTSIDNKK
ncbi:MULTISPECIES: hypothetical protein [Spirulina sp. CCY15215]|nr:hypothetical protein [Spirulina major]